MRIVRIHPHTPCGTSPCHRPPRLALAHTRPLTNTARHRLTCQRPSAMPGYLTKHESIAIAGVNNLAIRSLKDHQQFADPLGVAAALGISAATWPLFGLLWPSGQELAAHMASHPLVQGQRFLEIGCGLGLASLVGHRRGCNMTASDCHPLAAEFIRENLRLNGLPDMKYRHGHWGEGRQGPHPEGPCAAVSGRFDVIMGSDVLYERDDSGGLARFIQRHAAATAEVWIVDPHRSNRTAFNRRMEGHGFELTELRLDRLASASHTAYRGRLLTYHRLAAAPTAPTVTPAAQGSGF